MIREKIKSIFCGFLVVAPIIFFGDQHEAQPVTQENPFYVVDGWNVFLKTDYICWRWNQPISPALLITSPTPISIVKVADKSSTIVDLNPHYSSGFQSGIGFNMRGMDDWNAYAEYTWYKNKVNNTLVCGKNQSFSQLLAGGQFSITNQVGSLESQAQLLFNSLDVTLQRPFYLGRKIISTFGIGLSNLWITQKLKSNYNVILNRLIPNQSESKSKQTSWGIGPEMHFDSDWMLGSGFKLIGNVSASVLYTKYVWKRNNVINIFLEDQKIETHNTNFFRTHGTYNFKPITETAFGLGWGTYFCNHSFHLDFSALYDINIYWDYTNMLLENSQNMILHGLNIQARFDF